MKKFTLLLFALFFTLSSWATDFTINGVAYTITDTTNHYVAIGTGIATFSGVSSSTTGTFTIPSSVTYNNNTYTVTSIGTYAFAGCTLTSVVIPNTVTSIGTYAFCGCTALTSVIIPSSVISIGNEAFYGCSGFTSFTLPNSVTSIGNYAFSDCSSLTSISIPNSVTSIGSYAFEMCTNLTSVIIPNSVDTIGAFAFMYCTSLTSVSIPNSVVSIVNCPFGFCSSLTSISVDSNNPNYCSCDGVLFNKDQTYLIQYPIGNEGTSYIIPNTVMVVGEYAFSKCPNLKSVTIPNTVSVLAIGVFDGCSGLTSINIPSSLTTIGTDALFNCTALTSIEVDNSNPIYSSANGVLFNKTQTILYQYPAGNTNANYIVPNTVTKISGYAFYECTGISTVVLSSSVTSINPYAFYDCYSLKSIIIPSSVALIGGEAFYNCNNLNSIHAHNTTPANINLEDNIFYDVPTSTCILYVPIGSKPLYTSAYQWKAFTNIVEENISSGTALQETDNLTISVSSGIVTLHNVQAGLPVLLFDIGGKLLYSNIATSETVEFFLPSKGIYIVKVGNAAKKVVG